MDKALFEAFPSLRSATYETTIPQMAGAACLVLPFPSQGDLFPSVLSVPVSDLLWRQRTTPDLANFEAALNVLGYRLAIREDGDAERG